MAADRLGLEHGIKPEKQSYTRMFGNSKYSATRVHQVCGEIAVVLVLRTACKAEITAERFRSQEKKAWYPMINLFAHVL